MGAPSQLAARQRAGRASVIEGGCKRQSFSAQPKVWGGPCPIAEAVGQWETGGAQEGKARAGFTQGQTGAGRWFVTTFSIILSVKRRNQHGALGANPEAKKKKGK